MRRRHPNPRPSRALSHVVIGVVACLAGAAFTATTAAALPKKFSPYHKLNVFTRVLSYVENNYIEDVDQDRLIYGAIKGMLGTLDPHSSFMDPAQYREMKAETTGQFGGVGLEVEMRDGVLTVMSALEGTPAAKAGLGTGDQILKIEDVPTRGVSMDDAIVRMRGKKGSSVRLSVGRKAWAEPRQFSLVRDDIKVENVTWRMLEPGYGLVRVKQFSDNTARDLEFALDKLERDSPPVAAGPALAPTGNGPAPGPNLGAPNGLGGRLRGLVLDLRNNPGGLLDEAVRVADLFVDSGLIVRTEGKSGRVIDEERAHPKGTRSGFPLICLVNGGSASASEIVAGALQDHNRGAIMGTQTFGKGSVQTVIELDDGSALKLTIARYYTPKGRSIQEHGITPDVIVEKLHLADLKPDHTDEPDKKERDLANHLRNPQPAPSALPVHVHEVLRDDYQLQTAVDYLKAWQIFSLKGIAPPAAVQPQGTVAGHGPAAASDGGPKALTPRRPPKYTVTRSRRGPLFPNYFRGMEPT